MTKLVFILLYCFVSIWLSCDLVFDFENFKLKFIHLFFPLSFLIALIVFIFISSIYGLYLILKKFFSFLNRPIFK